MNNYRAPPITASPTRVSNHIIPTVSETAASTLFMYTEFRNRRRDPLYMYISLPYIRKSPVARRARRRSSRFKYSPKKNCSRIKIFFFPIPFTVKPGVSGVRFFFLCTKNNYASKFDNNYINYNMRFLTTTTTNDYTVCVFIGKNPSCIAVPDYIQIYFYFDKSTICY